MNEDSKVDFLIHLGDFKDEGPDKKGEDSLRFLEETEGVDTSFKHPRYRCIGNHEVDRINIRTILSIFESTGISKKRSYIHLTSRDIIL